MIDSDGKNKPEIILIASVASNGVIGRDGGQPVYLKADLKRFRQFTLHHPVIMGRKTFEAIVRKTGKPLSERTSIIITKQDGYSAPAGCVVCNSVQEAVEEGTKLDGNVFVIGGEQIFSQTIAIADRLELTEIHDELPGDVYFPKINKSEWRETSREEAEEDGMSYAFVSYERK
ncbi:dihydrofolate reductase [Candidatus Micrarchaeota archaeon]|nr:dihydrofolate reductase [Candidatus Micrarchaeota archaeon]